MRALEFLLPAAHGRQRTGARVPSSSTSAVFNVSLPRRRSSSPFGLTALADFRASTMPLQPGRARRGGASASSASSSAVPPRPAGRGGGPLPRRGGAASASAAGEPLPRPGGGRIPRARLRRRSSSSARRLASSAARRRSSTSRPSSLRARGGALPSRRCESSFSTMPDALLGAGGRPACGRCHCTAGCARGGYGLGGSRASA